MKPTNVVPTVAEGNHAKPKQGGAKLSFGDAEPIDEPIQKPKGILNITKAVEAKKKAQPNRDSNISGASFGSALGHFTESEQMTKRFVALGSDGDEDDEDGVPVDFVLNHLEREIKLTTSCKSLPLTLMFYLGFAWSAWLKSDTYNFGFGSSVEDLWTFVEGTEVGDAITKTPWMRSSNGQQIYVQSHDDFYTFMKEGVVPLFWREGHARIRQHHKILYGIRLRQTRSTIEECQRAELREWYGPPWHCRSWAGLSTDPFGNMSLGLLPQSNETDDAFASSAFDKSVFEVKLELKDSQELVEARIDDLAAKGWLDFQSRGIVVEMGLYNGQIDAFAFVKDEYIFHSDGSVHHVLRVATANNLFRRWYYFVADALLLTLIATLLSQEIYEIVTQTRAGTFVEGYLSGGQDGIWNLGDWAALLLGLVSQAGYYLLHTKREEITTRVVADEQIDDAAGWSATLDDLSSLIDLKKQHEVILFVFSLTILMKFFKGFRGQPRLAVLSTTFAMCCSELFYFSIIFMVIFSNFVVTSFLLFNTQIKAWSTLSKSFNECFKILMLKFEFGKMYAIHPLAASLWFWLFMIIALLIALSMLIAVILETYSFAKIQLNEENNFAQTFRGQLYQIWLQSRLKKMVSKDGHWTKFEVIRKEIAKMHDEQRAQANSQNRQKARYTVFVVTRSTLEELEVPDGQIDFFWEIWAKNLESMFSEEESIEPLDFRQSNMNRDTQASMLGKVNEDDDDDDDDDDGDHHFGEEDVEKDVDLTDHFETLDHNIKAQEDVLRVALKEILTRLQDHGSKQDWRRVDLPGAVHLPGQPTGAP